MSRTENPLHKKAFQLWVKSGRTIKPKEIAEQIGVSPEQVRKWKSSGKWELQPDKRPRGAPKGSKNAKGNRGGKGGPPGNEKALKHGLFRKFLPQDEETLEIFDATADLSPLELLWQQIRIAFTNLIRAQKITFVQDRDDQTMVIKKARGMMTGGDDKSGDVLEEIEYEYQHAWDKQNATLGQQSAAMARLSSMLKQYDEMLRMLPPDEIKEEQRLRAEKMKADVEKTRLEVVALQRVDEDDGDEGDGLESLAKAIETSKKLLVGDN